MYKIRNWSKSVRETLRTKYKSIFKYRSDRGTLLGLKRSRHFDLMRVNVVLW